MSRARTLFAALLLVASCGKSAETPRRPTATTTTSSASARPIAPAAASVATVEAADAGAPERSSFPPSTPVNELTAALLRALHAESGNVFLSGASLRDALGMVALGARGKTLDELVKTLAIDRDPAANAAAASAGRARWQRAAGRASLKIADRLWLQKSFAIERTFVQQARAGYGAAPALLDFESAAEPSRATMNAWVGAATNGKIQGLLPESSITSLTRVVVTNAVYFDGTWATKFRPSDTSSEPFMAPSGTQGVPTMHRTGTMDYAETHEAQIVSLPYAGSELSLVVVLPRARDALGEIVARLNGGEIDAWAKKLAPTKVFLAMPKLRFAWGRSIKPDLEALGLRTAFQEDAELGGIAHPKSPSDRLYVSDVFHRTFLVVDEAGTRAAAATGVVLSKRALIRATAMNVDHPFLIFVRDRRSGDILFAGWVVDPAR